MLTSATKEDALVLRYIMTYGVKKIPLPQVINNVDNLWIKKFGARIIRYCGIPKESTYVDYFRYHLI